jgi:serine/threonine protein kinase HipA of HipAB toxin-antitoxin module
MLQRKRKRADGTRTIELAKLTAEFLYLAADLETLNPEAARILGRAALDLQRVGGSTNNWNRGSRLAVGSFAMRH